MKLNRKTLRKMILKEMAESLGGMPPELDSPMPYRAKVMLGLIPGVSVPATDALEDIVYGEEANKEHRNLYFALQDLSDIVVSGYQNNSGQVQLRYEKISGRMEYLMGKIQIAKQILGDSNNSGTPRKAFIREEDALIHFVANLEKALLNYSI